MPGWPGSPSSASSQQWSQVTWTGISLTNVALATELFTTGGDLDHMAGSCCSVDGDGRLQLDNEGGYLIITRSDLGTFTPSASGRFNLSTEYRTSGGSLINGAEDDDYPIVNGLTNINPRCEVVRAEPVDVGSTFRPFVFQRSGGTRAVSARSRVIYLGDMPYPF